MKYKVPTPEDYPDVEGYEYKTIRAYSQMYVNYLSLLVSLDAINEALKGDGIDKEIAHKMLTDILRNHEN